MSRYKKNDDLNGLISEISQEDVIRRLKVLSKAQTTFLKAYLSMKLELAKEIVLKATDALSKHDDDETSISIRKELRKLKLEEIQVDFASSELMMHEEMELLRKSIEGVPITATNSTNSSVVHSSGSSEKDLAHIKTLEAENVNLRGLLKELKAELLNAGKKSSETSAPPPVPTASAPQTIEVVVPSPELLKQVEDLRKELQEVNQKLADKTRELKDAQKQLNSLSSDSQTRENSVAEQQKEINSLRAELQSVITSSSSSSEENNQLKKQIKELQAELDKEKASAAKKISKAQAVTTELEAKLAENQKKAEKEKEELMEAMAQEVEEVEKKHATEAAAHAKEIKKIQKSLSKYKNSSKNLSAGLAPLKRNVGDLKTSQRQLSKTVGDELRNMQSELVNNFSASIIRKLRGMDQVFADLNRKYKKEMAERKRLHNVIQELKGNIRVFLRCRPPSARELENAGSDSICVSFPDQGEVKVINEKGREKTWEFDEVFNLDTTQEQVYAEVSDLVTSVLDGYNVCIFAYGQTGSGKTFTMTGPPDHRGVNTRALDELFEKSQQRSDEWNDTITVSVLEVYNEDIHDLLSGRRDEKLEVKQGPQGNYVPGLTQVPVTSNAEVTELLLVSDRNRSQSCTNMNEHSSRSHMMLTVTITCEHKTTGVTSRGKLNLVDLAGSERINKSGATGQALKEAQNINKSLSALGDVIAARGAKQAHVPFRNSTLTYLLQDSLSQDSKTLMFVCISPVIYNAEETFCSLNFAARVRSVELGKASKNVTAGGSAPASGGAGTGSKPSKRASVMG